MTNRVNAFTVVLDSDVREDEIEPLIIALKQLKSVASVVPHNPRMEDTIAYERCKSRILQRLWECFNRELP